MPMDYMIEESLQELMDEVMRIRSENPQRLEKLCKEIINQSEGNNMYGNAFGEYFYAEACYWLNRPDELVSHAIKGLGIQKTYDFIELETRTYNLLGVYFVSRGDLQTAICYYLEGFELAKKNELYQMVKIFYNNFGDLYLRLKDYEKAIYYFQRIKILLSEHSDKMMTKVERDLICVRYGNLIEAFLHLGQLNKALETCEELLWALTENYYRNNSAMFYSVLTRLNYAKGKPLQGQSSAKLFLKSVMEKTDVTLLSDVYLPMGEFFIDENLMEEAECLLKFMKSVEDQFTAPCQRVELSKLSIKYYKKKNEAENLFLAYESYYQVNLAYELSAIEEKRKNVQVQMELHDAMKTQQNMMERNRELERLSEHDALTGLSNRYSINKYCEHMFVEACKHKLKFGVIIVDIDYFKEYNDTYGHVEGDQCIRSIARVIEQKAEGLLTARFGGDEFLVMGLNLEDEAMKGIADEICKGIEELQIPHSGSKISSMVSVSMGIVNRIPSKNDMVIDYIHMADVALYKIKKTERNSYGFYVA